MSEGRNHDAEQFDSAENPSPGQRTVRSEELLQGAREVLIQHGQETYRLRLTKAGKLILNK